MRFRSFKRLFYTLLVSGISFSTISADLVAMPTPAHLAAKHDASTSTHEIWPRLRSHFKISYPENSSRVRHYISKFITGNWLYLDLKLKAAPYLHLVIEEVEKRGLPAELALLPLIESAYEPTAIQSQSGAAGLWQIMPATGEWFGLKRDHHFDARLDISESTRSALDHLAYLHKTFKGDWLLALAAYNCGEGKVKRLIQKNKAAGLATDYWSLPLPKQTKEYVPKLLAVVSLIKQPDRYGFKLPVIKNQPYLTRVPVKPGLDLHQAAKMAGVHITELKRHNAGFQKPHIPNTLTNPHILIPIAKLHHFNAHHNPQHAAGEKGAILHVVKKGDSLWKISQLYQIPMHALLQSNNLSSNTLLQIGQKIFITEA